MWTALILHHNHRNQYHDISPMIRVGDLSLMLVHVGTHVPPVLAALQQYCTILHTSSLYLPLSSSLPNSFIPAICLPKPGIWSLFFGMSSTTLRRWSVRPCSLFLYMFLPFGVRSLNLSSVQPGMWIFPGLCVPIHACVFENARGLRNLCTPLTAS